MTLFVIRICLEFYHKNIYSLVDILKSQIKDNSGSVIYMYDWSES